eukprot:4325945-Amphidinium_carterae.1
MNRQATPVPPQMSRWGQLWGSVHALKGWLRRLLSEQACVVSVTTRRCENKTRDAFPQKRLPAPVPWNSESCHLTRAFVAFRSFSVSNCLHFMICWIQPRTQPQVPTWS